MNLTIFICLCSALTVLCRASETTPPTGVSQPINNEATPPEYEVPPPNEVYLDNTEALLQWDSHTEDVTYSVQYRIADGPWLNVPGCVQTRLSQCEFSAIATELVGATLRVRSQRNNSTTSPWQQAHRRVGCIHSGSCTPEVVAMASPGYLSVQIDRERSDQSLRDEYGGFLTYKVWYGREGEDMQVFSGSSDAQSVRVEPLPVGVRYCVKVRYLVYSKPYGNTSTPVCKLIPQSEWQRDVSLAGMLAGVFAVLAALSVGCYCFITRYHHDIKDYIRPVILPVVLEFPSDESLQPVTNPSESHDCISSVEAGLHQEQEEEEDRGGSGSMLRSERGHMTTVEEEEEEGGLEMGGGTGGHRDYEGSDFDTSLIFHSGTPLI